MLSKSSKKSSLHSIARGNDVEGQASLDQDVTLPSTPSKSQRKRSSASPPRGALTVASRKPALVVGSKRVRRPTERAKYSMSDRTASSRPKKKLPGILDDDFARELLAETTGQDSGVGLVSRDATPDADADSNDSDSDVEIVEGPVPNVPNAGKHHPDHDIADADPINGAALDDEDTVDHGNVTDEDEEFDPRCLVLPALPVRMMMDANDGEGDCSDGSGDGGDGPLGQLTYPSDHDHVYYEDVLALGREVSHENPFVSNPGEGPVAIDSVDSENRNNSELDPAASDGAHVYLKPLGATQWELNRDAAAQEAQLSAKAKAVAVLHRKRQYNTAYSFVLQDPALHPDYRHVDAPMRRFVETAYWPAAPDMPLPDPSSFIWFLSMVTGARPEIVKVIRAGTRFTQAGFYVNPARVDVSALSIPGGNGTVRIAQPTKAGLPGGCPYNACFVTIGVVKKDELDGSHATGISRDIFQKRITIHPLLQEWQLAVGCFGKLVKSDKLYGHFGESDVIMCSRKSNYVAKGKGASTPAPSTPGRRALFGSAKKSEPTDSDVPVVPMVVGPPDALLYTEDVPIYDVTGDPNANPPLPHFSFKRDHFRRLHEYPAYRKGRSTEIPPYDDTKHNSVTNEDITSFSIVAVGYTSQIWPKKYGKMDANDGDGRPTMNLNVQWVMVLAHQVINGVPTPPSTNDADIERDDDPWPLMPETLKRIADAEAKLQAAKLPAGPRLLQSGDKSCSSALSRAHRPSSSNTSCRPKTASASTSTSQRGAVPSSSVVASSSKQVGRGSASKNSNSRPSQSRTREPATPSPAEPSRSRPSSSRAQGNGGPSPVKRLTSPVWDLSD
ncbi:hypothetical protein HGRIS_005783 [Hohenbuehelia grisea]|uniref:Uncharacterized protein n=1 Tax=Hohenbuehelia grisea TaxID=104357 RepID=A0ABR3K068_9AGAR